MAVRPESFRSPSGLQRPRQYPRCRDAIGTGCSLGPQSPSDGVASRSASAGKRLPLPDHPPKGHRLMRPRSGGEALPTLFSRSLEHPAALSRPPQEGGRAGRRAALILTKSLYLKTLQTFNATRCGRAFAPHANVPPHRGHRKDRCGLGRSRWAKMPRAFAAAGGWLPTMLERQGDASIGTRAETGSMARLSRGSRARLWRRQDDRRDRRKSGEPARPVPPAPRSAWS